MDRYVQAWRLHNTKIPIDITAGRNELYSNDSDWKNKNKSYNVLFSICEV